MFFQSNGYSNLALLFKGVDKLWVTLNINYSSLNNHSIQQMRVLDIKKKYHPSGHLIPKCMHLSQCGKSMLSEKFGTQYVLVMEVLAVCICTHSRMH